ncbi:hypothetical protein ACJX0J_035260, partial [Zea mays]
INRMFLQVLQSIGGNIMTSIFEVIFFIYMLEAVDITWEYETFLQVVPLWDTTAVLGMQQSSIKELLTHMTYRVCNTIFNILLHGNTSFPLPLYTSEKGDDKKT